MKIALVGYRDWAHSIYNNITKNSSNEFIRFNSKKEFSEEEIIKFDPELILFYGWSWIISDYFVSNYKCLMLHPSPLPKYRGGSPIQNQILSNIKKTKISAFKVSENLDSGPICLQYDLSLKGSALDILKRIENKSIQMIKKIINIKDLHFKKQKGKPSFFKRRKPSESKINTHKTTTINKLYDFLRMLDAPCYPKAYVKLNKFKFMFNDIKINKDKINAKVEITKNEK